MKTFFKLIATNRKNISSCRNTGCHLRSPTTRSILFVIVFGVVGCSDDSSNEESNNNADADVGVTVDVGADMTAVDVENCAPTEIETDDGCVTCPQIETSCDLIGADDAIVDTASNVLTVQSNELVFRYGTVRASGMARVGGGISSEVSPIVADGEFSSDGLMMFTFDPQGADSVEIVRIVFDGACLESELELPLTISWEPNGDVTRDPVCIDL